MKWRLLKLDLKYAVGELLIVVLGVMIALYADQLNNDRALKKTEIEYVERLISDLDEDQSRIDIANDFLVMKLASLDVVYRNICSNADSKEDSREMLKHLQHGAFLGFSQPFGRRDTYDEMLSTGTISLLENLQIRTALFSYVEANDRQERRTQRRVTSYPALYYELGSTSLDVSNDEATNLWSNIRSSNMCNAVRAERNFGVFMQSEYASWQERQRLFRQQLGRYLGEITG